MVDSAAPEPTVVSAQRQSTATSHVFHYEAIHRLYSPVKQLAHTGLRWARGAVYSYIYIHDETALIKMKIWQFESMTV